MRDRYYERKKKIQLSVWRVRNHYYDRKKKYSCLSGGCAIVITTGKKKIQLSVWRVRDRYYDRKKEIVFGVTYVLSVQYSCAVVSVFLLWFFGVTYILSVQYSCSVVSNFFVVGKLILYEYLTVTIISQKYRELSL